ncbi:hypothetical protein F7725_017774 [Dissostichus mawsoni]|uniref:Uncharacterized protein n=1 Tax=Dissostichus mawsoni TaxID=36200 RepID=A0A7J5XR65_DISMA|nr:hypothetical protein F7725_017774 [Dissostichus mawsoni]
MILEAFLSASSSTHRETQRSPLSSNERRVSELLCVVPLGDLPAGVLADLGPVLGSGCFRLLRPSSSRPRTSFLVVRSKSTTRNSTETSGSSSAGMS